MWERTGFWLPYLVLSFPARVTFLADRRNSFPPRKFAGIPVQSVSPSYSIAIDRHDFQHEIRITLARHRTCCSSVGARRGVRLPLLAHPLSDSMVETCWCRSCRFADSRRSHLGRVLDPPSGTGAPDDIGSQPMIIPSQYLQILTAKRVLAIWPI